MLSLVLCAVLATDVKFYSAETKNFEVITTSRVDTDYFHTHIEEIKSSLFRRWKIKDVNFSKKCMLVIVKDDTIFKELFGDSDHILKYDTTYNGKNISELVLSVKGNWKDSNLRELLTKLCLNEYNAQTDAKIPAWMIDGISLLNGNNIKSKLSDFLSHRKNTNIAIPIDEVADGEMEELFKKYKVGEGDFIPTLLCLFLVKEFPHNSLMVFCNDEPLKILHDYYGFDSYEQLLQKFSEYANSLLDDIKQNKVPESYFDNIIVR